MSALRRNRSSLEIMRDTVFALYIRELRTRFGGSSLGYFWAVAEPAGQAALFAALFSAIGRTSITNVPVAVFMITGLLTFKLFSKTLTQVANAVQANKGLMTYRQVEPIDPVVTRALIEVVTYFLVFALLMGLIGWFTDYAVFPVYPLEFLAATGLLVLLSVGLGIALCSAIEYWPDTNKLLSVIMTPLMFVSGVFYSATMIPQQYWYLVQWNPIFNALELLRESYFYGYHSGFGSWSYLLALNVIVWFSALCLYVVNRPRFISG